MYTVYALTDPRDSLIRYVGITDNIYRRFKEHIMANGKNPGMNAWMKTLQAEQEMVVMSVLDRAEVYHEVLRLEEKWIQQLLAEGYPLFNISCVEPPASKEPEVQTRRDGKLVYDGFRRVRHTESEVNEILDYYLLTGELPEYVSDRSRYDYRHHPRLGERRQLLQPAGAKGK